MAKLFLLALCFLGASLLYFGNDVLMQYESSSESRIHLIDGVEIISEGKRLPTEGANFSTYSRALSTIGRTHVHAKLRSVIMQSYANLNQSVPKVQWIFGETGWRNGGKFWPHKTHRNGLSIDFMVPVINKETNEPGQLSLSVFSLFGYNIRFNDQGVNGQNKIDFQSIIWHLRELDVVSKEYGMRIRRVIFDPPLLALLKNEPSFHLIDRIEFMKTKAWFPHDSHYHVDFELTI